MGFIEDELAEVRKLCEHLLQGCRLVSCVKIMVRAEIRRTEYKSVVVCVQFPENYPHVPLLMELKSKTMSEKLLQRLTGVCEEEAKKHLGKVQVLKVLLFLKKFIDEHPLCCCYDEITSLRVHMTSQEDQIKLKQKSSCLVFKFFNEGYYVSAKVVVHDNYPHIPVEFFEVDTSFPPVFFRHMVSQVREIARQCVQPPLRRKPNSPPFKSQPSLEKCVLFLVDCVKRLPSELCQFCKEQCFPKDPTLVVTDENSPRHIERVYCGHLFHQNCLMEYMKLPPFGNKLCQSCGNRISHYKWTLSDKTAEDRWAHEQARERELGEVEDFFK